MSEYMNLTELSQKLQGLLASGIFEYTPTNVADVKYKNHKSGGVVELDGLSTEAERQLKSDLDDALRDADWASDRLEEARVTIQALRTEIDKLKGIKTT